MLKKNIAPVLLSVYGFLSFALITLKIVNVPFLSRLTWVWATLPLWSFVILIICFVLCWFCCMYIIGIVYYFRGIIHRK